MRHTKCTTCGGSGKIPDRAQMARRMRVLRQRAGYTQRELAALLEIATPYLCDLEHGRRRWRPELAKRAERACRD